MGAAVPYAVGAKFCFPDRCCIAMTGDGAMQMNDLNACITVAKYWREWSDPRWITLVLNNRDLNMVTWEQRIFTGDTKFEASQDLPDYQSATMPMTPPSMPAGRMALSLRRGKPCKNGGRHSIPWPENRMSRIRRHIG